MANNFFTNEYTDLLQKAVRQVVNDPKTYIGSKYLPSVSLPARKIRVDVIEASGGLTNEHIPGTAPKSVQGIGAHSQEFDPGAWKEEMTIAEDRLLYLRELGQNDRSLRGARKWIDLQVDKLNRRLEARIEKLRWDSIFNGSYTFMGRTVSFGVPAANQAVPLVGTSAVWSSDGINANSSAKPLLDLRYWLLGGLAGFRKYKVRKVVLNPNTARWILDNSSVTSLIQYRFAAENFAEYDLNRTLQFLVPGLPEFEIYDGWYQTESVDANGKVTVSDAVYFVPDGYLFFEVSNLPGGDMVGEFVQGVNLAGGSVDEPGYGKFLVVEDNTAPQSKGGPANPYISLVAGVYGGPKIDRAFDLITAKVV
jgi:hypothetical protein